MSARLLGRHVYWVPATDARLYDEHYYKADESTMTLTTCHFSAASKS